MSRRVTQPGRVAFHGRVLSRSALDLAIETLVGHWLPRNSVRILLLTAALLGVNPASAVNRGAPEIVFDWKSQRCQALFDILPHLAPGVVVHFHDIFWPFEYPADWLINRRYSWNELYGLRAFLAYNETFEVLFFNDLFGLKCRELIAASKLSDCAASARRSMGGGLWLKKLK
jgi:hypothetical protein